VRPGLFPSVNFEGFFRALAFLTRLPVPKRFLRDPGPEGFSLDVFWIPVVGGGIGALLALFSLFLTRLPVSHSPAMTDISAFLILLLWIFLTGGLHLDGVADTMECALAEVPPEEKRRVRKDPRKGVYAVVALVLVILGKWIGIVATMPAFAPLFLAPFLSRAALVPVIRILARSETRGSGGLGSVLLSKGSLLNDWILPVTLLVIAVGSAIFLEGERGGMAVVISVGATMGLGRWALGRIDGMSGDLAGLLVESGEVFLLVGLGL